MLSERWLYSPFEISHHKSTSIMAIIIDNYWNTNPHAIRSDIRRVMTWRGFVDNAASIMFRDFNTGKTFAYYLNRGYGETRQRRNGIQWSYGCKYVNGCPFALYYWQQVVIYQMAIHQLIIRNLWLHDVLGITMIRRGILFLFMGEDDWKEASKLLLEEIYKFLQIILSKMMNLIIHTIMTSVCWNRRNGITNRLVNYLYMFPTFVTNGKHIRAAWCYSWCLS